jgi:SAM-dependent methyltransferase
VSERGPHPAPGARAAKQIVREGYDAAGAAYLAARARDSEDVRLLADLVRRLPEGAAVLDAGCGAGVPVAELLSRRDFAVTGVDISPQQVARARRLVPGATFVCADMARLAFPDESFDAICSYYAIIHVPREQHPALLRNFRRMLKPGGWALLCLGWRDLPFGTREDFCGVPGGRMYWSHYDAETNLRLIRECGFEVEWSRLVRDFLDRDDDPDPSRHLFVLARKPAPSTPTPPVS